MLWGEVADLVVTSSDFPSSLQARLKVGDLIWSIFLKWWNMDFRKKSYSLNGDWLCPGTWGVAVQYKLIWQSILVSLLLRPHKYSEWEVWRGSEMQTQTSQIVFNLKTSHNIITKNNCLSYSVMLIFSWASSLFNKRSVSLPIDCCPDPPAWLLPEKTGSQLRALYLSNG